MAVNRINEKASLALSFVDGMVEGKEVYVNSSYTGIDPDATDQKLYDVGLAFAGLSEKALKNVGLRETVDLVE